MPLDTGCLGELDLVPGAVVVAVVLDAVAKDVREDDFGVGENDEKAVAVGRNDNDDDDDEDDERKNGIRQRPTRMMLDRPDPTDCLPLLCLLLLLLLIVVIVVLCSIECVFRLVSRSVGRAFDLLCVRLIACSLVRSIDRLKREKRERWQERKAGCVCRVCS